MKTFFQGGTMNAQFPGTYLSKNRRFLHFLQKVK